MRKEVHLCMQRIRQHGVRIVLQCCTVSILICMQCHFEEMHKYICKFEVNYPLGELPCSVIRKEIS